MIIHSVQGDSSYLNKMYELSHFTYDKTLKGKDGVQLIKEVNIVFSEDGAILTKTRKKDGEIISSTSNSILIDQKLINDFTMKIIRLIGESIKCDEKNASDKEFIELVVDGVLHLKASLSLTNGHKYLKEVVTWFFDKANIKTN